MINSSIIMDRSIFQLPIDFDVLIEKMKEFHKPGAPPNTLTAKMVENRYLMMKDTLVAYVQRKLNSHHSRSTPKSKSPSETSETCEGYFNRDDLAYGAGAGENKDFVLLVQAACLSLTS